METKRHPAGGETVLAKLAELLFVEVIRQHVEALPAQSRSWLSWPRDRHIGRALGLMHGQPAADWTLGRLANRVGLSRSVSSERFNHYVGLSPMQYLARWRMQVAGRRLEHQESASRRSGRNSAMPLRRRLTVHSKDLSGCLRGSGGKRDPRPSRPNRWASAN